MDSDSSSLASEELPNPKRLKTLACNLKDSKGNNLLHKFVLDNSHPNKSGSANYINAVLLSMSDISAGTVNAQNNEGYNALHLAVSKNNPLMVNRLLSCIVNIDINASWNIAEYTAIAGYTALYLAVESGHASIIQELLNKGADLHVKDTYGRTHLHHAVTDNYLKCAELLIEKGADLHVADAKGRTPLHYAGIGNRLECAELLINKGAYLQAIDNDGETPLHVAVSRDSVECVKLFLGLGADLNAKYKNGKTLLHKAVSAGSVRLLKVLVENGIDVNAWNECNGFTSLHRLLDRMNHSKLKRKPDFKSRNDIYLEKIKILLEAHADLNIKDTYGETPFCRAIRYENDDAIKLFAEYANDLKSINDEYEDFLLKSLIKSGSHDILELLLRKSANVNVKNKFSCDSGPLYYAIRCGNSKIAKLLLDNGADIKAKYLRGDTVLHVACEYRHQWDIFQMLVERGSDLNAKNEVHETPLNAAAFNDNLDSTRLLLERGADVNISDIYGRTPLHTAASKGHLEIVTLLVEKGADLNAEDKSGRTPVDLAAEYKHQLCMDALQKPNSVCTTAKKSVAVSA